MTALQRAEQLKSPPSRSFTWARIVALLVTIVAINLVGDQLRDVLNPRLRK